MVSRDAADRLAEAATAQLDRTLELLERLVAQPSIEGSETIARCLDIVAAQVAPIADSVERPMVDGLGSLIARFGSGPDANRLSFSGHVDVVPVGDGWETPPFDPARRSGRLYGRGTCDMKGGVAAFVGALHALAALDVLEQCSLELVLTGDEEVGSRRGLIPLLEQGVVHGRLAVCGEPTGLDVFLGNRGLVWLEVRVRGRGGHAGLSHALSNPVPVAAQIVTALHQLELPAMDERFTPPRPSLNVTRVDAGAALQAVNVIPDTVALGIDRRLLPGEDPDDAIAAIRRVVDDVVSSPWESAISVLRTWPPYAISLDEPVARAARDAVQQSGRPGHIGMDSAANDSSWLDRAGIPTVLLGPGAPHEAHTTNESVRIAEVRDAIEIYTRMALALARGSRCA